MFDFEDYLATEKKLVQNKLFRLIILVSTNT